MRRHIKRFLLAGLAIAAVCGGMANGSLVVPVATEIQLIPVYLSSFQNESQNYSNGYVKILEEVLHFDLDNNGMSKVKQKAAPLESLAKAMNFGGGSDLSKWKEKQIAYVIKVLIGEGQAETAIISVNGNWIKAAEGLPLTGELSHDQTQMHTLADMIHKTLFGKEGIARTRILYTLKKEVPGEKKWTSDIWEVDYCGGNAHAVLTDAGYCVTPQYAPPELGKRSGSFFYVSYKTGQPKIYLASLINPKPQRFSLLRGNQLMPTLSYQRDKVAFISDATGNPDLFLQDFSPLHGAIGKPRQIFTSRLATQGTPTFSPCGKKIAFVSDKDGSPRIYAMDIPPPEAGSKDINAKVITKFRRGCTAPAWSPDGTKIAYCAQVDGARQIFVYNFETNAELQLTKGPGNKENPAWAPNSLHLVYNAGNEIASELFLINLNELKPVQITNGQGQKRFPSWEPSFLFNR